MSLYARRSPRLVRQVMIDAFVVCWTICWFIAGRVVDAAIRGIADPVRGIAESVGGVRDDLAEAATRAGSVPGIGDLLRSPFDTATGNLGDVAGAAQQQAAAIETAATLLGIGTFIIPVLIMVVAWLPARLRFHRENSAARRMLASGSGVELLALRALARQPVSQLIAIDADPVAAWRAGDRRAIDGLADLELVRLGLQGGLRERARLARSSGADQ